MAFVNVGFGNMVSSDRVVAVASPESAPIKRIAAEAREAGKVIDVSCGHKTKSVIVTDSEFVILSAISSEKIADRLNGKTDAETSKDEEEI